VPALPLLDEVYFIRRTATDLPRFLRTGQSPVGREGKERGIERNAATLQRTLFTGWRGEDEHRRGMNKRCLLVSRYDT